jgi:isoleucyl-tRNA synthetase
MSKSLGNVVLPTEICDKWGADLLRLWVGSQEYQADVKMSERVMTQLSEAYRKIRNTIRFALGNLNEFDPSRHSLSNDQLDELDRWMLERTADLVKKCREWYAAYEFHRVYHAIHDYCIVDLSAFYYDVLKDRLYTKAPNNKSRRSGQTAIWKITGALVRLLAPILVFTAEESWKFLPHATGEPGSVHVALFPDEAELRTGLAPSHIANWERLAQIREEVLNALELARNNKTIASSLEARVTLCPKTDAKPEQKQEFLQFLRPYQGILPGLFIVSQVDLGMGYAETPGSVASTGPNAAAIVVVHRADGKKCDRCWNYSTHVGENPRYPTVCERCSEAIAEIERNIEGGQAGAVGVKV